mmetsp:Transcript_29959/g.69854  ORF Transcript_29959/g.69854 Transcript_29959/m.69854 type:complete len:563 (+) Transcript_29959:611-2299(+)
MLQHKWRPTGDQTLEVAAMLDLIRRFPAICQVRYDMHMGYGNNSSGNNDSREDNDGSNNNNDEIEEEDDDENNNGNSSNSNNINQELGRAKQQPKQQTFEVRVPDSVQGGQSFDVLAGGVRVRVMCPIQARPGQRIRFRLPTHKQTVALLPLSIVVCLNPPLELVRAIYEAYPTGIYDVSHQSLSSSSSCKPKKSDGLRALDFACQFKASLGVIAFLHQQDPAAVKKCTLDQALPLHRACSRHVDDHGLTVHYLLDQYPLAARQRGFPSQVRPLHLAIEAGAPLSVIQRLIQYCPDSLEWDPTRNTPQQHPSQSSPLHLACRYRSNTAETVQYLCRVAPDLMELPDAYGYTPIFLAAKYQTVDVLQCLLPYARYVGMDEGGPTLLHFAARYNTPDVVEYLANACPWMVTAREEDRGRTPLFMACSSKLGHAISSSSTTAMVSSSNSTNPYVQTIRILLKTNPKCLGLRNKNQQTPLDIALQIQHKQQLQRQQRQKEQGASSTLQRQQHSSPIVQVLQEETQRQEELDQQCRKQSLLKRKRRSPSAAGFGMICSMASSSSRMS